jgi:hypothetical protein
MIDAVMKKYRKKRAQSVQEFRSKMFAKQRDGKTCVDMWQRLKRSAQGLRSACRTIETMDLVDALNGSLHPKHVPWMIIVDTSTVALDELEEKVLTIGQNMDQVMSKDSSSHSSAFMAVNSNDIDIKLDNVTKQLTNLSAALLSSRFGPFNRNEGGGRGRGGGRNVGGRGRKKKTYGTVGEIIICYNVLKLY